MKIAIQGHPTRGKEIIQILKSLGATSYGTYDTCSHPKWYWYINKNREITCDPKRSMCGYKLYTLEEFEKEFPFKVGDEVIIPDYSNKKGTIINIDRCGPILSYFIKLETGNGIYRSTKSIKLYKEMEEERNITLTLDKAKEWYKKGGELKEIALQAFTEKELTKVGLPKTWEEFRENNPVKAGECWLAQQDIIHQASDSSNRIFKNWIPSKKSAEAHLAMIQLEQLRNCWRQGWKPTDYDTGYCITHYSEGYSILSFNFISFLSFPTKKMAEEFLECFGDLIEKAGDLI